MKKTRNRPAREVPDEQEILSYWFPPGIHEAGAETYRRKWLRWFGGGPEVEQEITGRFGGVLTPVARLLDYRGSYQGYLDRPPSDMV